MLFDSVQYPDSISYLVPFEACSQLKDLQWGKRLVKSNINLRSEFRLQAALFDVIRERFIVYIFSWKDFLYNWKSNNCSL